MFRSSIHISSAVLQSSTIIVDILVSFNPDKCVHSIRFNIRKAEKYSGGNIMILFEAKWKGEHHALVELTEWIIHTRTHIHTCTHTHINSKATHFISRERERVCRRDWVEKWVVCNSEQKCETSHGPFCMSIEFKLMFLLEFAINHNLQVKLMLAFYISSSMKWGGEEVKKKEHTSTWHI